MANIALRRKNLTLNNCIREKLEIYYYLLLAKCLIEEVRQIVNLRKVKRSSNDNSNE